MAWSEYTIDTLIDDWGFAYTVEKRESETPYTPQYDSSGVYIPPTKPPVSDFGVVCIDQENANQIEFAMGGPFTTQKLYCITRSRYEQGDTVILSTGERFKVVERMSFGQFDMTDLRLYKLTIEDKGALMQNASEFKNQ